MGGTGTPPLDDSTDWNDVSVQLIPSDRLSGDLRASNPASQRGVSNRATDYTRTLECINRSPVDNLKSLRVARDPRPGNLNVLGAIVKPTVKTTSSIGQ